MEDFTIILEHSQKDDQHTLTFFLNGETAMIVSGEALSLLQLLRAGQKHLEGEAMVHSLPNIHLN